MAKDKKNKKDTKLEKELKEELEKVKKKLQSNEKELKEALKNLEEKEEEAQNYISHSQRLQADFENFKKQSEKQNREIIKFASENLMKNILDSYEDLKRALDNSNNEKELKEGVKLIYSKLNKILTDEGLKEIPTVGEKFDPFKHEALMVENNEKYENGYIIEELMKGYTLKDKVIKYSKVKVCKK